MLRSLSYGKQTKLLAVQLHIQVLNFTFDLRVERFAFRYTVFEKEYGELDHLIRRLGRSGLLSHDHALAAV